MIGGWSIAWPVWFGQLRERIPAAYPPDPNSHIPRRRPRAWTSFWRKAGRTGHL